MLRFVVPELRFLVLNLRDVPRALSLVLALGTVTACADVRWPEPESPPPAPWTAGGFDRTSAEQLGLHQAPNATATPAATQARANGKKLLANADPPASPVRSDASASSESFAYQMPVPALDGAASATRVASLSDGDCQKEVARLGVPVDRKVKKASGVTSPMHLTGPLHGVRFVTPGASSPYGVLDCRMALALNDLGEALAAADVVVVHVDNLYRPHAHLPGKKTESQHASALAADITSFELRDGRVLSVGEDWHAPIGSVSCGPEAVLNDPSDEAIALRNIVCDVARRGLFHHMLSPSFNAAHRTHLHFDIKRGETKQSVR